MSGQELQDPFAKEFCFLWNWPPSPPALTLTGPHLDPAWLPVLKGSWDSVLCCCGMGGRSRPEPLGLIEASLPVRYELCSPGEVDVVALAWRGRGSSSKNTPQPLLEMATSSPGGIILVVQAQLSPGNSCSSSSPTGLTWCWEALGPYSETEAQRVYVTYPGFGGRFLWGRDLNSRLFQLARDHDSVFPFANEGRAQEDGFPFVRLLQRPIFGVS